MKKPVKIILTVVAVVVAAVVAGFLYYRNQLVSYQADLSGKVFADVIIERDEHGVPRIEVSSEHDMFAALGYVHAQDRFVYMEYFRSIARSQLSKLIGAKGESLDRLSRIIGFRRRAERILAETGPRERLFLDAYVRGVDIIQKASLYKNSLDDPWDPADVIAILLVKEWSQAFLSNKEMIFQLSDDVRGAEYPFLAEIIPREYTSFYADEEKKGVALLRDLRKLVRSRIGTFNRGFAVYVPDHITSDGRALSAYSYEDGLGVYPGWYPVCILIKGRKIMAVTHAGLPFLFSGQHDAFSFYGFSLNCDTQDFLVEKVKTEDRQVKYLSAAGWKNFIEVRDPGSDAEKIAENRPVWETESGPVLNDIFFSEPYKNFVVTVKSFFPGADYVRSLFEVPFAKSVPDAVKNIKGINSYPKAYLFADEYGSVTAYSGRVPITSPGNTVFKKNTAAYWNGFADCTAITTEKIRSAAAGTDFMADIPPVLRGNLRVDEFRLENLMKLLSSATEISRADLEKIMNDDHSVHAAKFTPLFLLMLENMPVTSARLMRIYFSDWKFDMDPDLVAPTLFHKLLHTFIYSTLKDDIRNDIDTVMENYVYLLPNFLNVVAQSASPCFDDRDTYAIENREAIFDRSFLDAMRDLNRKKGPVMDEWRWGSFHRGHFNIPFTEKSLISRMIYKIGDRPIPGGNSSVVFSSTAMDLKPLGRTSLTGVFHPEDAVFTMNCSYSINPMSRFYYGKMDMVRTEKFADIKGKYLTRIVPVR